MSQLFKVEITCAYYRTFAICICIDDNNRNTEQSETVLVCEQAHFEKPYAC